MNILESLRTAGEALLANKMRTMLTMLGIIIGVAAVVTIVSIGRGTNESVLNQLRGLGTELFTISPTMERPAPGQRFVQPKPFTDEDLAGIRQHIPDAKYVVTVLRTSGQQLKFESTLVSSPVMGVFPEYMEMMGIELESGRFITSEEMDASARVIVLHGEYARQLMPEIDDPVGETVFFMGFPYEVIGVMREGGAAAGRLVGGFEGSMVPFSTLRRSQPRSEIREIMVKVQPGAKVDRVMQETQEYLETMVPERKVRTSSPEQVRESVTQVTDTLTMVAAAIAAISLVVGGVGIMNIMLVSVTERTREIGIRKALGATDEAIMTQFIIEAVSLCMLGGGLGLAFSLLPMRVASLWMRTPVVISWDTVAMAVGFSAAIGIIFGVYPAAKAARLDPIEALRYE